MQEGASRHGSTEEFSSVLQTCGATARMVQLQILDQDKPSRRQSIRLTCEGESPGNGLSQILAGKPIINAG